MIMLHLRESGISYLSSKKCVGLRIFRKARKEESYRSTTTVIRRPQSCFFAQIISVNPLGVYGAISDWCQELAQQISDHSFSSTGKPVASMNEESGLFDSHPMLCRSYRIRLRPTFRYRVNLFRNHNERFETLPEDIQVIQASETCWNLMRKSYWFSWTIFPDNP